jgi:protein SCO1/2
MGAASETHGRPAVSRSWSPRLLVSCAIVALALGAGVGIVLHVALDARAAAPAPAAVKVPALEGQAVWPPGRVAAPEIRLRDQTGQLVSLHALRGKAVVLAFMDSRCRQVCPLEGRVLGRAIASMPPASRPAFLVVSVDPWADTGVSARVAASHWGFDGSWHWLFGSRAELAKIWRAYRIYVKQTSTDIVHSDAVYVIDRHGDERAGFLFPFLPQPVERDLAALAREGA